MRISQNARGLWTILPAVVTAFQPQPLFHRTSSTTRLNSEVGDGPPPPNDGGGGDSNSWDDFLNPNRKESENLQRAREYMSEESLPISFDTNGAVNDEGVENDDEMELDDDFIENDNENGPLPVIDVEATPSAMTPSARGKALVEAANTEKLAKNPYMKVVSNLSPSDLISKFTSTAHPRVQNAVRATILGLIGSLPKMAFDTTTITTGERLASLMFQLQMTGYMFKNAEYRLSLSQSLGMTSPSFGQSSNFLLTGAQDEIVDEEDEDVDPLRGKVRGKIKVRYGGRAKKANATSSTEKQADSASEDGDEESDGLEMEVDAAAYMSELRSEVSKLREELNLKRQAKEEALRKDLLLYIRTLPQQELRQLTNTISEDVLVAMKGLVNVVMAGIGEGQISPDTVTEQSAEAMAQLCMWQLVVGYNLRELEVREEMKTKLFNGWNTTAADDGGGVDFTDEPGMLE